MATVQNTLLCLPRDGSHTALTLSKGHVSELNWPKTGLSRQKKQQFDQKSVDSVQLVTTVS